MKFEKIGMRTIKTGIAVMFCVLIAANLVQNLFFSAIGCVVSVQDTVKGSMKSGLNRVYGTVVGGTVGFLSALISPGDPVICGLGTMVTIYACNTLKLTPAILVSCITFFGVHLGVGSSDPAAYAINRAIDTSVGVIFGVVINYIMARPDYLEGTMVAFKKIEKIVIHTLKVKALHQEKFNLEKVQKELHKLERMYSRLLDELDYSRNKVNTEQLLEGISICKEIYFHMQCIELLEKKLYINKKNHENLKKLYKIETIKWEENENQSPVFNYHLSKIIEEIEAIKNLNESNL
ncbi:aromatic acid exporter family protein [Romboutsia weinsteinii]|uniref:Aromatic acid exporter family protein n=1 Tax=Romboutsia weinsteinii TaxID=2020949 RepID=A0A371IXP6_9FIRM|nr:aromatic acid exporter family protein [Romboutsia weinsteinii]RDY25246.1 aromatic acid exporter family protein [Romboutsia weinsteinii]